MFFSSETDVALLLRYTFADELTPTSTSTTTKKRKLSDPKQDTLPPYSQIKLPVKNFLTYLESYGNEFAQTCLKHEKEPQ